MNRYLLYLLSGACIAGMVRLGIWQVDRGEYKEALLAHSRQVLSDRNPTPLAAATDAAMPEVESDAYDWAAGDGHFLPLPALRLDNQVRNGVSGLRVYRVFQPDGARRALLVELGWRALPSRTDMPVEPPAPPSLGNVRGLMSPPPVAGLSLGGGTVQTLPDKTLLLVKLDPKTLATTLHLRNGLSPRVLRLDPQQKVGYKRDLLMLSGTLPPEKHRGYAVQWFGLAGGLLAATIVVARRKPRRKPDEEAA